ncbi:MAG: transketolase [Planctomycetota bacterium]|nr:MAG: transketolase [Planctomycetota bacterium]REJ93490.1 MAG: transketolase [Planctomycetota bacterium]REK23198.1 MAG: transketolase [Planctomycetota bacterium]REK30884.1 MAG: transketolase [Planctomycetota bacterium]
MPKALNLAELKAKANEIRKLIIRITTEAGSGHPTSSLSATDVVTALYFGGFMKYDPANPKDPGRDRFILSKGHACPVLYSAMAEAGYFSVDDIMTLRKLGSPWEGHPNMKRLPGIEASTGSLGQGLSIGIGHALAGRMDNAGYHVYVMLGDGESGEGQVWEAFAAADKYKLGNLTAIIDRNGYQQTGATEDVLDLGDLAGKINSFGWHVQTIDGNQMEEVVDALGAARDVKDQPTAIVANTRKGYGILPVLETTGDLNFHGKPLPEDLAEKALAHLSG